MNIDTPPPPLLTRHNDCINQPLIPFHLFSRSINQGVSGQFLTNIKISHSSIRKTNITQIHFHKCQGPQISSNEPQSNRLELLCSTICQLIKTNSWAKRKQMLNCRNQNSL